uniref:Uncharacterized protein n=1 Tax=Arundo donax TaxID=35708 RepID=A0A0A8ZAF1_ARUDO
MFICRKYMNFNMRDLQATHTQVRPYPIQYPCTREYKQDRVQKHILK